MSDDKAASYFADVEFLAAADWCQTETTRFADVVLPGSTFLESEGTRVNFEGKVIHYTEAVPPAAGIKGWEMLAKLAIAFGISEVDASFAALSARLEKTVRSSLGGKARFLWNTGEARDWDGSGNLIVGDVRTRPSPISPPLTVSEHYKRQSREVGLEHFRVQGARA